MSTLKTGDKAPGFRLWSNQGAKSLDDYGGEWTVVYFYPKDNTPGCTKEACDFRDAMPGMGAKVLGVSADDVTSHEGFAAEHSLPFPLLSDPGGEVAKSYGSYGEKTMPDGRTYEGVTRSTFIIDPAGIVAEAMYSVNPDGHAEAVGERLRDLQKA